MIKFLFWFILIFDFVTPILFSYGYLDTSLRGIPTILIIVLSLYSLIFQTRTNKSLSKLFIFLFIFIVWYTVISLSYESEVSTVLWGIMIFLKFPLIGILVYNNPDLIENIIGKLAAIFIFVLVLELILQSYQYFVLLEESDNIGGTFGNFGTSRLFSLVIIMNCFFIAYWLTENTKTSFINLIAALGMSVIISILGEIKVFYFFLLVALTYSYFVFIKKSESKRVSFTILLVVFVILVVQYYPVLYDNIYGEQYNSYFEDFLNVSGFIEYNNQFNITDVQGGEFDLGRTFALYQSIEIISVSNFNFLFGFGFGSRSESAFLNSSGVTVASSSFGNFTGASLTVFLCEYGLIGTIIILAAIYWLTFRLHQFKKVCEDPEIQILLTTVILFSFFWPLMLFYSNVWIHPVSMFLYWAFIGFLFRKYHDYKEEISIK